MTEEYFLPIRFTRFVSTILGGMRMRVTTNMVNESARKAGLPINQNTLLSYLNGDEDSSNTLLDSIGSASRVSSVNTENYRKLEKVADSLGAQAEKFAATGEDSFLEKLKESGDAKELTAGVKKLASEYNNTLNALKKAPGVLNDYYRQMLEEAAAEEKTALAGIGITIGKNGSLEVDSEKLEAAAFEDIQKVLGGSGELTSKMGFIAGRISDNAQASLDNVTNQYTSSGNLYSQLASKYDFWS